MEVRILLVFHIAGLCSGLRDVRIQVPIAVKVGDSVTLICQYDIEDDDLYTLKWYRANQEFYRFAPRESPVIKTFPVKGFSVDEEKSNATQVTLVDLETVAAGIYRCEVSADAPSFQTFVVPGMMDVVELPEQSPIIIHSKRRYRIGDTIKLTCVSGISRPPANLTWFINNRRPPDSQVHTMSPTNHPGPRVTNSSLQFIISQEDFIQGNIRIRCAASIYQMYWESKEVVIEENGYNRRPSYSKTSATATGYGIAHYPPSPNYQIGQEKPDGQFNVRIRNSTSARLKLSTLFILGLLMIMELIIY